ncbi:hypothetical protein JTB14_010766 [Gonioctena quinquepunctata]|nr:hypothetical protein JTB14_010766 [Gonioctena quinquepunctata]
MRKFRKCPLSRDMGEFVPYIASDASLINQNWHVTLRENERDNTHIYNRWSRLNFSGTPPESEKGETAAFISPVDGVDDDGFGIIGGVSRFYRGIFCRL